jgi:hypothetical protein
MPNRKSTKDIMKITIMPSSVPISYNGKYYLRSGSTVQELQGKKLTAPGITFLKSKLILKNSVKREAGNMNWHNGHSSERLFLRIEKKIKGIALQAEAVIG